MSRNSVSLTGLALLGLASACVEPEPFDPEIDERAEAEEADDSGASIEALLVARPELEVASYDRDEGTVHLRGPLHEPDPRAPEVIADETLERLPMLWRERDGISLTRATTDSTSEVTHVRYQQRLAGVPVFQGEVVVHVRGDGRVASLQARTHRVDEPGAFEPIPTLGAGALEQRVREYYAVEGEFYVYTTPELLALVDDGEAHLVWSLSVLAEDFPGSAQLMVDAHSGEVLRSKFITHQLTGTACDPFGNSISINTTRPWGAQYHLHDRTRPGKIRGYDQGGSVTWTQAAPFTDTDNHWCEEVQEQPVLGHDNMGKVLDFFNSRFGRSSYDGSGGNIKMGYDASFNNPGFSAYQWNAMALGNGVFRFGSGVDDQIWTPLDVVGHEFTHDVLLEEGYSYDTHQGQSFHEHVADVFGTLVELDFGNGTGEEDFILAGETNEPDVTRNLLEPPVDGDHYSEYVAAADWQYANSQILSLPFALLASEDGGIHPHSNVMVPTIGSEDVRNLYYETITNYLSPGEVSAVELADALRDAAADEFGEGSTELFGVEVAYLAAGLNPSVFSLVPYAGNFSSWRSGGTPLTYGAPNGAPGVGTTSAKMEDGKLWDGSMFGMTPASGWFGHATGSIDLRLPANLNLINGFVLAPHIRAEVGFPLIAPNTDTALVNFLVRDSGGSALTNASVTVTRADSTVDIIDMDLEAFAGQSVTLEIWVYNNGPVPSRPVIFDSLSLTAMLQ
ncbi:MAG: M4 family metallopeptidase [Myxococcota bacterium]